MTFLVKVLVERQDACSSRILRYDGDAAFLHNEVSYGIAVISAIEQAVRSRSDPTAKQSIGLSCVTAFTTGKNEAKRISKRIAGHVNLGGKPASGTAQRMT